LVSSSSLLSSRVRRQLFFFRDQLISDLCSGPLFLFAATSSPDRANSFTTGRCSSSTQAPSTGISARRPFSSGGGAFTVSTTRQLEVQGPQRVSKLLRTFRFTIPFYSSSRYLSSPLVSYILYIHLLWPPVLCVSVHNL
jgi:hypothetical protein